MPQKTYMYDTQWTALLNAIGAGDSSAVVSALNTIKNSLDDIKNAISSQSITVDLSNINSDNVSNLSNISGNNISIALNYLLSIFSDLLKIQYVEIANTNISRGMNLSQFVNIPSGYKFLAYQTFAVSTGWVTTFPIYLSDITSIAGIPFWNSSYTLPSSGFVRFYYFIIKDV